MGWAIDTPIAHSGWAIDRGPVTHGLAINQAGDARNQPGGLHAEQVGIALNIDSASLTDTASMQAWANTHVPVIAAAGIKWVRFVLYWSHLQPTNGAFQWAKWDALMTKLSQYGISACITCAFSATWASNDTVNNDTHYPPKRAGDYSAYATYCAAVASRYGPGGSFWTAGQFPVCHEIEIWNEPWLYVFWQPDPNPAEYALMAVTAATAIRAANPSVQILATGDAFQVITTHASTPLFLANVVAAQPTLATLIDAWVAHPYVTDAAGLQGDPYDDTIGPNTGFQRALRTATDAWRLTGVELPVVFTEFGWNNATSDGGVTETVGAAYAHAAISRALRDWDHRPGRPGVSRVFLYGYFQSNGVMTDREGNYGVIRSNGTLKPVWDVLKAWQ